MLYYLEDAEFVGQSKKKYWKVTSTNVLELKQFATKWSSLVTATFPPRKKVSSSRKMPNLLIPEKLGRLLEGMTPVNKGYYRVLLTIAKLNWWKDESEDEYDPVVEKHFRSQIRAKLVEMLDDELWIDDPEDEEVENLNRWWRNFDLGRRKHLKFRSWQNEAAQAEADAYRKVNARERERARKEAMEVIDDVYSVPPMEEVTNTNQNDEAPTLNPDTPLIIGGTDEAPVIFGSPWKRKLSNSGSAKEGKSESGKLRE